MNEVGFSVGIKCRYEISRVLHPTDLTFFGDKLRFSVRLQERLVVGKLAGGRNADPIGLYVGPLFAIQF